MPALVVKFVTCAESGTQFCVKITFNGDDTAVEIDRGPLLSWDEAIGRAGKLICGGLGTGAFNDICEARVQQPSALDGIHAWGAFVTTVRDSAVRDGADVIGAEAAKLITIARPHLQNCSHPRFGVETLKEVRKCNNWIKSVTGNTGECIPEDVLKIVRNALAEG